MNPESNIGDQNICFFFDNDQYICIIWEPDFDTSKPNLHIVDAKTNGDIVNAAYEFETGKFYKHGSCKEYLNDNVLEKLNEFLQTDVDELIKQSYTVDIKTYWNFCILEWNMNNSDHEIDVNLSFKPLTNN